MRLPKWVNIREPLSWLLGAGLIIQMAWMQEVNEYLLGVAIMFMGYPGASMIDEWLRSRREGSNEIQPPPASSLPPVLPSSSSTSSNAGGNSGEDMAA